VLKFEKAMPSQRSEIERIFRGAFASYVHKLGWELSPDSYIWLGEAVALGNIYLAIDSNVIVGAISTIRGESEIIVDKIAVDPTRQGAGIGSWLLEQIEEAVRSDTISKISLDTAEMMESLVRLYERHGFQITRRGPPLHGKDAHTRVFMTKFL
jgi:ribosomal protein S18 acetylase RimI-like enzyme